MYKHKTLHDRCLWGILRYVNRQGTDRDMQNPRTQVDPNPHRENEYDKTDLNSITQACLVHIYLLAHLHFIPHFKNLEEEKRRGIWCDYNLKNKLFS